jgi:large subunit ribosomal protein L24
MKQKFSTKWKASRQPRKQRKYRLNAPLNTKHRMMSAHLSKELRKKYGKRSFTVKKGDNIRIMIGEFKKKTGKIENVNLKRLKVSIEGIQRTKKDGAKLKVWFDPSNLIITDLNLNDKKRTKAIERKAGNKNLEGKNAPKKE